MDDNSVKLNAVFSKATTTVDGGWRITFDCSYQEAERILQISAWRDMLVDVIVSPAPEHDEDALGPYIGAI